MKRACKHEFRVKVDLFLDIPLALQHRITKQRLRSKYVRIDGAGWPQSIVYCRKCGAKP